ncbi:MAG: HD-GYP domain-containing protein [Candidatus Saccharibacteria bacterium]
MDFVRIEDLQEGMIAGENICEDSGKLLITAGSKLTTASINSLKRRRISAPHIGIADRYTIHVEPIQTTSKIIKEKINVQTEQLAPSRVEANKSDEMVQVSQQARAIGAKLADNKAIAEFCMEMRILKDGYLFHHCINTCVLSLLVGGAMGLDNDELLTLGQGALLHDIGYREMPTLIHKKERTSQEEALWREHPNYGYYLVREAGFSDQVCAIVQNHHEHWDGSGFPKQCRTVGIPKLARIVAVCDIYDYLIRNEGLLPHYAIEYLYGTGNVMFDGNVINAFVNNLAVYPLGALVRLSTGEVGVVVNVRQNMGPRPIVMAYYNRVNRLLASPKEIDLGQHPTVFVEEVL